MTANPTLLSMPLAQNGQKNVIPETQATAGDGLFSQSTGFPAETSLPLGAGGVAPSREDFNGLANLLGGVAYYAQKGWKFQFDAGQDYFAGCIVRDTTDGKLYECINDVAAGGSVPSADSVNWKPFKESGQLYLRKNSTAYAVGDIAYNENLPSYTHLLCTTGGTTDSTEPDFTGAAIGGTVSDGTVVWTYSTNYDIERDFTIIYPNGGTAISPANVSTNAQYIESNPFSGYYVSCEVEVQYNGKWIAQSWTGDQGTGSHVLGVTARQNSNDGTIVINTGRTSLLGNIINAGSYDYSVPVAQAPDDVNTSSLPCRVKVWKVGKM